MVFHSGRPRMELMRKCLAPSRFTTILFVTIWLLFCISLSSVVSQKHDLTEMARQSIVYIYFDVADGQGIRRKVPGTGFVVSNNGYVLTASHLVREWKQRSDLEKYNNQIVGTLRDKPGYVRESPLILEVVDWGDPE